MKKLTIVLALLTGISGVSFAQNKNKVAHPPIIDVHVHAGKVRPGMTPICPWFLSDMPGADPLDKTPFAFLNTDCLDPWPAAQSDEEMKNEIVRRIKDFNMTMIAFGDAGVIRSWMKEVPKGRIIPGIGFRNLTVDQFRDSLKSGFYKVFAETGMDTPDEYLAVAEELNIPVGIHSGTGGNGSANISNPNYRASSMDPFRLEDILIRHPKLKVYAMHAGYPLAEHMIALMGANAYVYVDISGMIWSYPLDEVNDYIKKLVQAGFGKRIMYGTDFISWPRMIEGSVGVIEHAQYLSEEQKRDILFNNAARFFRLDKSQFNWPE
jgi:uncharacterized protein